MWIQHLIVLSLVAVCLGYVGWQGVQAMRGRKTKLGSCCSKGCAGVADEQAKAAERGGAVHFIPVEMLVRKRSR